MIPDRNELQAIFSAELVRARRRQRRQALVGWVVLLLAGYGLYQLILQLFN